MQSRKLLRRNLIKYSLASALTFASVCASAGPWNEHTLKVSGLATQMKGHENEIKELIERRKRARDPEDIKSIMEAIATQHKRYEEAAEKFNAEWLHMRFKHPEQAATLKRQYERVHIKTVHDMETEIGMDGRLDRLKAHVLQIFPLSERSLSAEFRPKVSPLLRRPASVSAAVKAEDPYEFESIHLVK